MGFVVSALGIGGIIASTCMDQWSTQDLYNNPVTAVFNYQGLWRTCVRESSGFTECRGYFTILGLPDNAQHYHLALQALWPKHSTTLLETEQQAHAWREVPLSFNRSCL
ncbi:claudin-18 [Grus japonensis]|uniref:Claudin n=1 Tax=Grus japonensis TaxID=30415 RepID=A0ABC9X8Q8_GRUJA